MPTDKSPTARSTDPIVHAHTPVTDDVQAWLARTFPEGDAFIVHDTTCDQDMIGDECEGGCPVYSLADD